jgi:vacuolar protein sorting-associated protein 13A/C
MTEEERNKRNQQLKKDKLANAELLADPTKHAPPSTVDPQEEAKNESFINQLTTKIVDNLQFSMKNIHIRYEDKSSMSAIRCWCHSWRIKCHLNEFRMGSDIY